MGLFESLFDILYLLIVIGFGLNLVLSKKKEAHLFGWMAIILGSGDAFHLIPRVLSHLSPQGFKGFEMALSWGQCITGITMTVFYLLFYYYYRRISGDTDPKKKWLFLFLGALRILLVLLPQNQWGHMPGNYQMGIIRNIPFAIMGLLLILWTRKYSKTPGLKNMSLLIFLSFAFYIPVVLWADTYPWVGALMMPKTVAYVLIVLSAYKHYREELSPRRILVLSEIFLIMGLVGGVFYREFTKFYAFTERTHLSKLHVHSLALGFIFLLVLYVISNSFDKDTFSKIHKPLKVYISGLVLVLATMTLYGIYDVIGMNQATVNLSALSGLSGLGHIILAVGLVWIIKTIKDALPKEKEILS